MHPSPCPLPQGERGKSGKGRDESWERGERMTPEFWHGKRVFLTGHTGFKGAWLSLWLARLGARVAGYALVPPSSPSLFELGRVHEQVEHEIGDVTDLAALTASLRRSRAEIVIHMAAQALVRDSYVDPVRTYASNVMGTVNLLEAVRQVGGVRAVLIVTSDKCYENPSYDSAANSSSRRDEAPDLGPGRGPDQEPGHAFKESDPMGGFDPYSSSKGAAELVVASYRNSFFHPARYKDHGVALASARAGNVIGGGDWAKDRLIPDIVRALLRREPPLIRSPRAVRPWQHVLEPLSGYLTLCEALSETGAAAAEGWNFGPVASDARPVAWIADRMVAMWGEGASWTLDNNPHPHEAPLLYLDTEKARTRLGYRPRWSLDHGLAATVAWAKAYRDGEDVRAVTLEQITAFVGAGEQAAMSQPESARSAHVGG